eukprot:TRINITY_DN67696_c2_g5_i1.p1 TRINITY_DN67696_c2_g5~~TRINITY_DN67696_c2_g5_i1.p1  ORF type:complete len:393 (-),score=0.32 TRINITY_DN67696_c2_g5_i1:72-1250(-)
MSGYETRYADVPWKTPDYDEYEEGLLRSGATRDVDTRFRDWTSFMFHRRFMMGRGTMIDVWTAMQLHQTRRDTLTYTFDAFLDTIRFLASGRGNETTLMRHRGPRVTRRLRTRDTRKKKQVPGRPMSTSQVWVRRWWFLEKMHFEFHKQKEDDLMRWQSGWLILDGTATRHSGSGTSTSDQRLLNQRYGWATHKLGSAQGWNCQVLFQGRDGREAILDVRCCAGNINDRSAPHATGITTELVEHGSCEAGATLRTDKGYSETLPDVEKSTRSSRLGDRWKIEALNRRLKSFRAFRETNVDAAKYKVIVRAVAYLVNVELTRRPLRRPFVKVKLTDKQHARLVGAKRGAADMFLFAHAKASKIEWREKCDRYQKATEAKRRRISLLQGDVHTW